MLRVVIGLFDGKALCACLVEQRHGMQDEVGVVVGLRLCVELK